MVSDCKTVEIPPKLMTNEVRIVASFAFSRVERSMHPFVISMHPSVKNLIFSGRNERMGARDSITMKKIVIMQPTERIERVEFKTISLKSAVD